MRNAIWLAAVLVFASAIAAQSAELRITGPVGPIATGEAIQLPITGLDPADRPSATAKHFDRPGVVCIPATTWPTKETPSTDYLWFSAKLPGRYLVWVMVSTKDGLQYAEHIVVVGTSPDPDPDPDPDPPDPDPPNPNAKWQVMFFQKSDKLDNYDRQWRTMLAGRKFRDELEAKGHSFEGAFDRDAVGDAFAENKKYKPWWAAVKGDSLPRVAIAPIDGGTIRDYPLPKTVAELYQLLGGAK